MRSIQNKNILLFLILFPLFSFSLHEYYISHTKIEYSEKHEAIQITMRFFIDDIEKVIEFRSGVDLELATRNENRKANELIATYIDDMFKLDLNGNSQTVNYLGKEYENDMAIFYLEIEHVKEIESIEVVNAMLFEKFPEQKNYVKFKIGEVEKTFVLVKSNDKEMLKF